MGDQRVGSNYLCLRLITGELLKTIFPPVIVKMTARKTCLMPTDESLSRSLMRAAQSEIPIRHKTMPMMNLNQL